MAACILRNMRIKLFNKSINKFIGSLDDQTIARTLRTFDLLEKFGPGLGMPHSKKVGDNLFELRVRGKKDVRIFYGFHNKTIIVVHGFVKKTQKIPKKELILAKKRLKSLA